MTKPPPVEQQWTTRRLLEWMTSHFQARGIDSPRVVAEMLLSHVLGCERMRLYMESDRPATAVELATLRLLAARAAAHEPVQYLVGQTWFFSRAFEVDRSTLIPRPSTETLVEHVLHWLRATPGHADPLMADIGTGTGCIAISLAAQLPGAHVIATDVEPGALELASRNAARHRVEDRIEFLPGALLEPLRHVPAIARFDVICSNPPYISDREWEAVAPNVREFEPAGALRGGADGLDVIRPLIAGSGQWLKPGGLLAVEIAHSQRDAALELARAAGLVDPGVLKDHEGLWRVLLATRAE
jgi:release factor glutamine methyltransferase